MRIRNVVYVGQTRTTTEPLACTDGTILPAGSTVTVTEFQQRGWTVRADDGRVAEGVAGVQLGLTITEVDR